RLIPSLTRTLVETMSARTAIVIATLVTAAAGKALADGDAAAGRALAEDQCARCHVVSESSGMGIESTPSFRLLVGLPDWKARFQTFYARRPHIPFVLVRGRAPRPDVPANIVPFEIEPEDIENLIAFAGTIAAEASE